MKTKWKMFLEDQDGLENDFPSKDSNPPLGNLGSGISENLMIISRKLIENHLEKYLRFIEEISRNDHTIKHELERYRRDPMAEKPRLPSSNKEPDVVNYTSGGNLPEDEG